MKAARERGFPLELMEKGYTIDIRAAEATRPEDRRHILNSISRARDLDADPDLTVITGNHVARGLSYLDRLTGTLAGLESPAVGVLGPADRLAGAEAVTAALAAYTSTATARASRPAARRRSSTDRTR